jgi:hypothetical protein
MKVMSIPKPGFMKHLFLSGVLGVCLLFANFRIEAQIAAGNHWVLQTLQQDYWKFPVSQNGIYRIDSTTLAQAGVLNAPGFDPRKIQVFHHGNEIPLFVLGEQDGLMNAGDYVEFFGKRNDASMDKASFADTTYPVNIGYSLYSDTTWYFLTLGSSLQNLRITFDQAVDYTNFLPAEEWFMTRVLFEPAGTYGYGGFYGEDYSKDSRYFEGEGWIDFPFGIDANMTNPREVNITTQGVNHLGPNTVLNYVIVGRSKYAFKFPAYPGKHHHVRVAIDGVTGLLDDFTYSGYFAERRSVQFPSSKLSSNYATKFLFSAVDDMALNPSQDPTRSDRNSIAWAELTFPHGNNLFNVTEKYLYIPDHSTKTKTYLSLSNLNTPSGETILYDLTNQRRIKVTATGVNRQMLIPNSAPGKPSVKECYLTSEGSIRAVTQLKPLTSGPSFQDFYSDFSQKQYDYLIITHSSLLSAANQYAQYRKTGGYPALYNPVVVDVEELFEQFSWGIRNNPMAIENFLKYLHVNNLLPPYVFILGKGYATIHTRKDNVTLNKSLIPGWGYPATDNMYINRLSNQPIDNICIGRVAAATITEANQYLDKVRQYEDSLRQTSEMWMKRAIHLGGGNSIQEQSAIKTSLARWEGILESPKFGGSVTTFLKTSTEPIEILKSQQLKNLINSGVRLMSFFGHGSSSGFDISTDEVSSYDNEGRYPLVIANSCYSGDLFNKTVTKSEEFVLTPKKGAIAYLGSSSYSTISVLNELNDTLYNHMAGASYGATIGMLTRKGLAPLALNTGSFFHQTSYQQTSLHGDPAIVLSVQDRPDYRLSPPQIYFSPSNITNELDSFTIHVISRNAGMALKDSFALLVSRTFPDKTISDSIGFFPSTAFQDTFSMTLPVNRSNGVGQNLFRIALDALEVILESDETNNEASVILNIKSANLIPVYPYDFAVIPGNTVTLYASTADPFSEAKRYHFQIDDDPGFISPLAVHTVQGKGGLFQWTPQVQLQDSMVYFWRVSVDSLDHPDTIMDWRISSFRVISGKYGWAQAHFHQFLRNDYQYITPDTFAQRYEFALDQHEITAHTGIFPSLSANQHYFSLDGLVLYQSANLISQGLDGGFVFAVFDTINGQVVNAVNSSGSWEGNWGNLQEPGTIRSAFEFPTYNSLSRSKLTAFFDSIPLGYYVLGYSIKNHFAPDFPEPLYQAFESIGSAQIRNLPANSSYIIFGRKGAAIGDPVHVKEDFRTGITDTLKLSYTMATRWNQGKITSTDIGPATYWKTLYWKQSPAPLDPLNADTVRFSVIGVDASGNTKSFPALTNLLPHPDSVWILEQVIDASLYPYIRLKVEMSDKNYHTPAQMKSWMVLYTPVGETALDPKTSFSFHKDTIQQGDSLKLTIATRNISPWNMDSLLVNGWIVDSERKVHQSIFKRYGPHPAGDTLIMKDIAFSTLGLSPGMATLWFEVNPVNTATAYYDQPEQTHVNNFGDLPFVVYTDHQNPLLDVAFDGIHILDGDIVSAQPMIGIQLNDENLFYKFNQPEDTALFRVYLKYPLETEFRQVHFRKGGEDQMIFYPASGKENSCRIHFPADFLGRDGTYVLRVEATDKAQNSAGSIHYQVSFKVISHASITEVLNWPNPFSSRTHFVFTLTGFEVPTDFRIQIMTISGKVIRELTTNDLGPVNLGRNITAGYWDGTDEFGDRVANGVYLYRVISNIRDEKIDKASTKADQYFKEGWGKMYLMR